ncbi:MAG TPA: tetratricopeptide repeat protein, partial [Gaiellaceae bacterium]|nr:tetratricopeptide repeat protein [Gaiellaceae bacterium]
DAHSLYLEALGELGIVGFLLIVAALGGGLVVGILRTLRSEGDGRAAAAALTAALLAFLFESGIDWMWETTVVTVVAMVCLGLLTGPATVYGESKRIRAPERRWVRVGARAGVVAVALVLVAAQAIPLLAQSSVGQSQDAATRGDAAEALRTAKRAERIQPWAASTHLQRALVEELSGNVPAALTAIQRALAREPSDWRLWVVAARLETKAGQFESARESLDRAVALNPRSQILAEFAP